MVVLRVPKNYDTCNSSIHMHTTEAMAANYINFQAGGCSAGESKEIERTWSSLTSEVSAVLSGRYSYIYTCFTRALQTLHV